ncbi:hypothetical protein CDV36_001916 [Fusarium kuroshium]|uniref:Uncharacterized protein n=1 Tax=Fusarium kuroshium TaxID=2010991 RepID=A0A3M2SLK2_9HYPO|nr:hypothetical protein CDV36_001916 [Fusarium kuroshium]
MRLKSIDNNNIKFGVISHLVAETGPSHYPSINDDLHRRVCYPGFNYDKEHLFMGLRLSAARRRQEG